MIETAIDGRYLIVARLASGGMGEVYRAQDPVLGRDVAIKVLHTSLADDPGFIDRFRREARSAAMLTHPNIVSVHDWGEAGGTYFMVMEYVRGPNLRSLLLRDGALQPAQSAEIVTQILTALEHAHRQRIVHRDIKPENVMITSDGGAVKVADFGLARALADARVSQAPGTVTGTVQYLAPEQIEGRPADPRTDLYATGIVLYELLTGTVPYTGETSLAIAYRHLRERVFPPSRSNPMVPPVLDRVVLSMTEPDQDRRTPDARTARLELARAMPDLPPAAPLEELAARAAPVDEVPADRLSTVTIPRPPTPAERRGRRFRGAMAALALVAALAAGAWAAWTYLFPHQTRVPTLEGKPVAEAQRLADRAGLDFVLASESYSTDVSAGRVITQSLEPGSTADEGDELSVVVSRGPRLVGVPGLEGLPLQKARDRLADLDLRAVVRHVYSGQVPDGTVIDQSPFPGTRLEVGKRVDLRVSRGPAPVDVPDVVGSTETEAAAVLDAEGLGVDVVEEFSATVGRGRVIRQEPPAGATVETRSTVTIVLSKGPRTFAMPDVIGMSRDGALEDLEGRGLDFEVVDLPGSSGDTVVGQDPKRGVTVRQGQRVKIYVGGG